MVLGQAHHTYVHVAQIVDASILKQYIFQKSFITEAAKAKREAEAQAATLQVHIRMPTSCRGCLQGAPVRVQSSCAGMCTSCTAGERACARR
jgi:hypothetical protein